MLKNEIEELRKLPLDELISFANKERQKHLGNKFELCSIINAKSGACSEDCKFCAQSRKYSTNAPVYSLKTKEEIVEKARFAKEIGAENFSIVTSGKTLSMKETETIAEIIQETKEKINIKVDASLGILNKSQLNIIKNAGLSRYHHNIETSPTFFPFIVSTNTFKEKIETIEAAKETGLEVCSGDIIGMGESENCRIEMATILNKLDVDSVPINILVPIKGTPLENVRQLSIDVIFSDRL